ncbi:MAG TPA: hypothetical protein VJ063_03775 [Verrucomicrobiae bacterium]|nr:hypothetical protein [Verrucomicrobiae bacterium]
MSLKDVIYMGLIILSGVIFYLHGVDCGVRRTRRLFERYLGNPKAYTELPPAAETPAKPSDLATKVQIRGSRAVFSKTSVQGIFGKN